MKRISITIRADVSSVFTCSKMSYVSLNKLPFLYCHDESLTINISHKAQEREITNVSNEREFLNRIKTARRDGRITSRWLAKWKIRV